MEGILSKNDPALPLGIRCMELSIKEADNVIKEFLKKNRHIFDFSNAPSWKFPHINIEKLDVLNVMETYRIRSVSEEKQYLELMEMFIDRLYFSLMATYQFLESSEISSAGAITGQGDSQQSPVKLPLDVENKKSSGDQTQRPFQMANIGDLLRQIHAKLLSTEIIPTMRGTGRAKLDKIVSKKSVSDNQKLRHSLTQTEFSALAGCESCYLSQNLLKFLGDTVSNCFKIFTEEESQITSFRQDLEDDVWLYSQRSVVVKWCEAIESDCHIMFEKAGQILQQNTTYKIQQENLQLESDQEVVKKELLVEDLKKQLKACEDELQNERKHKRKVVKQRDSTVAKSNEVERQLLKLTGEAKTHDLEKMKLQKGLSNLEHAHRQLQSTQTACFAQLMETKLEVEKAEEEKKSFSRRLSGLEVQMDLKDQEILNLKKLLDKFQNYEKEKLELRKALASTKQRLEDSKRTETSLEKACEDQKEEVRSLKDSLEHTESQIELLTLYPDLNGPINPPSRETGNPLQAMEMQLKSNKLRMDVLKAQTERLNATLGKLRCHMQSH